MHRLLSSKLNSKQLTKQLQKIVGAENVLYKTEDLIPYEMDGTVERHLPDFVIFPSCTQEIVEIVELSKEFMIPITPRGAGTGLSGGAIAIHGGIVIATTRMRKIIEIDPINRIAIVEPGVPNINLTTAAASDGLFYAPDPSSQKACTIGGNIAENAGGPHCLALGVTTNHVLGMEIVTADGEPMWVGGKTPESVGYDVRGLFIGSEGTLGIATKIVVRLLPIPATITTMLAIFNNIEDACHAVSSIIECGLIPAALELIDKVTLQAAEAGLNCGYPSDAEAVLLIEIDGLQEIVDKQVKQAEEACKQHQASEIRKAQSPDERELLWKGRKGAIGALGRIAPNYYILDGVVPRSRLVETMLEVERISEKYGFPVANVFHAGDGNIHPNLLFDERIPGTTEKVLQAGAEIMNVCISVGGALSGEHGVGYEKQRFMPWLYNETDLENMRSVRTVFGNSGMFNPCKILPEGSGCGEIANIPMAVSAAGPDAWI